MASCGTLTSMRFTNGKITGNTTTMSATAMKANAMGRVSKIEKSPAHNCTPA
jgi:hypothetical protein